MVRSLYLVVVICVVRLSVVVVVVVVLVCLCGAWSLVGRLILVLSLSVGRCVVSFVVSFSLLAVSFPERPTYLPIHPAGTKR